ncbi:telomere length regulation protein-domain-containing protein [Cokeromyces recurvatus]|uniref:telomere length regulation protein-domain-containing protein n=1 Tax=Cokeromyces recurvatus TaxID=90255 RepID=UPI00221EC812|nr:telomere length regulation protein-domain-containing protein [Cokeromyces recurvatus]KAI7902821.1 telomere length regulation protein-domain-containing protein [Cokeromyces recurvatus]
MESINKHIEQLIQLDQEALIENATLDTVVKCISLPLEWLGLNGLSTSLSIEQRLALTQHTAWKRHVWNLFKEILPRWTFAFNSTTAYRSLLDATLFFQTNDDKINVQMAQVALPILIECISSQSEASLETLELYSTALKLLTLSSTLLSLYACHISHNDVRFFCSMICSIPGHLVNVFGIQLEHIKFKAEHEWYIDRNFYAKLSHKAAKNFSQNSVYFTQELLGKIIRQGYEDIVMKSIYSVARSSPEYWPILFEQIEIISSFEKITKSILQYVKQDVLPKSNIQSVSKDLAAILFGKPMKDERRKQRINHFLNTSLLRMAKLSWADEILARLVISTVIYAEGVYAGQISSSAHEIIISFIKRLIQTWSDTVFIRHASFKERLYITKVILVLIAYLSDDTIRTEIMGKTSILYSVSDYFDSGDISIAQLGAVVAEAISSRIDKDKPLDTGLLTTSDELLELKKLVNMTDALDQEEELIITSSSEIESENENGTDEEELDPDAIYVVEDEDEEESEEDEFQAYFMEEESDDEGLRREGDSKIQNKRPVFVRDLIQCLQDQNDPLRLEIGLKAAEQVIRQRAGAGTELSESSVKLASYLIGFPETYEIQDFRKLQQNALTALIASVPTTVTGFVIDQIYDRNTSAGQKQLILGAISMAVRELAGWIDNESIDEATNRLENATITTNDQVGKPLFISRKMEIEKQHKQNIRKNKLSGLAGPVFFFPLLVGWWEGTQGLIKHWIGSNPILAERFIMTLNIILHSSTNTSDKRKIVREYFEFALSMRCITLNNTYVIRKAILLGIDIIISTSYKGQEQLLFHDFLKELVETKQWLQEIMENQVEQKIQELAISILVKLSQITLAGN